MAAAVLFLAACSKQPGTGVSIDGAARKYVSSDSKALAAIQFDALKASPLYRDHQAQLGFPALDGTAGQLGLDPRRDVSSVIVTWNGKDWLAEVRGRFAKDRLARTLAANGKTETVATQTVYEDGANAFAVPENGFALGGSAAGIKKAIEAAEANRGEIPDALAANMAWLPKSAAVWIVSRGSLPFAEVPTRSDYSSLLSNFAGYISATALGLSVDSGLHIKGRVSCVSAEGGKRVNDALRGIIGLGRLSTKDNELELLRVYDAIHVKQESDTVYVTADLDSNEANRLLGLVTQSRR